MNRTEKCGTGASLLGVRIPPSRQRAKQIIVTVIFFLKGPTPCHIRPHINKLNRLRFRVLIETPLVASLGDWPRMQKSIDQLKRMAAAAGEADYVITHMEQQAAHPHQSRR